MVLVLTLISDQHNHLIMKAKFIYFKSMVVLLTLVFTAGCKKLDLAPKDTYSELTFWQVDANVNSALASVYSSIAVSTNIFYNDGLSDNAYAKLAGGTFVDVIASGNFTPTLGRFINEWTGIFRGIKSCNLFLDNVDRNTTLPDAVKNRMKAEVRFIRAWHHFTLMKWWGDAPVVRKDISPEEAQTIARSSRADVLKFVLDELDAVTPVLPKKEDYSAADNGRITKGAALALKARVLLYEGNRMSEVVTICEQLINNQAQNGAYSLSPKYSDLFSDADVNKKGPEPIFSLQFASPGRTWGEYLDFAPISVGARVNGMAPTQELVDSYIMLNGKRINEAGSGYDENDLSKNRDPRLAATVVYDKYVWTGPGGSQTIYIKPGSTPGGQSSANEYSNAGQGSPTGYYWRKYFDPKFTAPGFSSGLNLHLIRYADVLLMYAEAKQSLGQFDAGIWDKTIKLTRQRAGFTDPGAINFPTSGNLRDIIRNERRSEFAMEGLRIDDIRRWRIAETVLNGWAHGAKYGDPTVDNGYLRVQLRVFNTNRHYLWPVPASEILLNKNLTQNPNY
jgi:starch-binding outer membrane protein, SusD/RagB family